MPVYDMNNKFEFASGYFARYDAGPMRRVFGLFVYTRDKSCPHCGSEHVHRTKRGRLVEFWVLLFLPVRPYRCGKCRLRFYAPKKFPRIESPDDDFEAAAPAVRPRREVTIEK